MNANLGPELGAPVVTVVVPTYNRASLLVRAIGSVLAQTLRNWELIVVDDCSTDETEQVVRSFSDDRIKYIRHDRNRRVSAARNTGIRCARGEYVAFLDDDDEWLPEKLQKVLEVFRNSDPEVGLVYTGEMILDARGKIVEISKATKSGWIYETVLASCFIGSPSRVTVKKQVLDRVAGFDEKLVNLEDCGLWLRVAKVSKVACVPSCLVKRHFISEWKTARLLNMCEAWERILRKHRGDMKPRIAAGHLSRIAILLFNYNPGRARTVAWEGLRTWPIQPLLFAALAVSTLGMGRYRWVFSKMVKLGDKLSIGRARL